jgi:signal transduction histidine kinase/CheY-like chemotaxis protein
MREQILSRKSLLNFLESDNLSLAIADKNQKIIWFNKNFKQSFGAKRIKGITFTNLFSHLYPEDLLAPIGTGGQASLPTNIKNKTVIFLKSPFVKSADNDSKLDSHPRQLTIRLWKRKGKIEGYILQLEPVPENKIIGKILPVDKNENRLFSETLQQMLTLLVKEKSLSLIMEEILRRSVVTIKGDLGIIIISNDEINKLEFQFYDPADSIKNRDETQKEIKGNISYINKWLTVNKRSILSGKTTGNIGYQLTQVLQCRSLIISPCFFDEKLLALIIVGKKEQVFSDTDVINAEQFAAFLSFAISNIRMRELNTALESRLLQSQKLETIGKLSSGMAHDFSNLLSSIFGSLNLLKKRVPDKDDILRLLENIENCSIRAKDLTKGLLSFGKPTPKRRELIKPNLLISEISKVITQTFPSKISFVLHANENLYDILGNGTEIYQVLLNLCVNAKEAIAFRGRIELSAKNITVDETNLLKYPLMDKGNYVWLSIKDNGAGIKEDDIPKIFDPYFSTKDKQSGSGSGLGLYVTYGIIKAHKGHIEVTSALNEGTTFDVFLPSYEPLAVGKQAPENKIILLADDEVMLLELLSELLESSGFNVIKVPSAEEAIKVLTEEIKVNLAIIDYNMPGMDGLQCVQKIRELKFDMPVILSSGSISFEKNFDYKKAGASALIAKPYEFETMLATIQKLI